jgi:hypothetical protein
VCVKNLDESQTFDMYRLYLLREFRGSRNTLKVGLCLLLLILTETSH